MVVNMSSDDYIFETISACHGHQTTRWHSQRSLNIFLRILAEVLSAIGSPMGVCSIRGFLVSAPYVDLRMYHFQCVAPWQSIQGGHHITISHLRRQCTQYQPYFLFLNCLKLCPPYADLSNIIFSYVKRLVLWLLI